VKALPIDMAAIDRAATSGVFIFMGGWVGGNITIENVIGSLIRVSGNRARKLNSLKMNLLHVLKVNVC
jgi:hypothetical protein